MRVLLATLTAGSVSAHYCSSLADLLSDPVPWYKFSHILAHGGPLVAHQRNVVVKHFLGIDSDYLLFVDADIKFAQEDIRLLLDSKKDIVGARYYGYSEARDDTYPTWQPLDDQPKENELIECSHIGMGCTLISREALVKLGEKPFGHDVIDDLYTGEDVTFCHRAKAEGIPCFINKDARVFHVKARLI